MARPIILTLAALLAGCAAGAASRAPGARASAEASPPTLLVAMQQQGCPCQSYRLEIDTHGEVRFHSNGSRCTHGPDVFRLPADAVVALRAAIARSGFATTAENCCDKCIVFDASTLTVTVADGAAPKTIIDKECSRAPTTVRDLAQTVERIIGIERWIYPEEERDLCPDG